MGRDNTLPDQVAGMKDLAKQFSFIDIDRAAMWGHSGGGFITADAMFREPGPTTCFPSVPTASALTMRRCVQVTQTVRAHSAAALPTLSLLPLSRSLAS